MMSLWDALRMNMMISYQELVRTFLSIMSEAEEKRLNKDKIMMLSSVVADLAELAIATNKIANSATYSSGYKDAKNV